MRRLTVIAVTSLLTAAAVAGAYTVAGPVSEANSELQGRFVCQGGRIVATRITTTGPGTWSITLDHAACAGPQVES